MAIVIHSPYRNDSLPWLRGNLHAHTTNSDGRRAPQDVVDGYAARGYDFLMLSDHDTLTDPASLDSRGMTLIPGNEVTAHGPHVLHVNAPEVVAPNADRQRALHDINAAGGFAVVAHPNWETSFEHCPRKDLEAWTSYAGIEVYNGVIRWLEGSPLATDRWDRLLGLGRRVWGFANDDSHRVENDAVAWNMVQSAGRNVATIVSALREGRFYASTGVTIDQIRVSGQTIRVETRDAQRIIAYSDFGRREAVVDAPALAFTVADDAELQYVRFECWGPGEQMAWTQPFFVERA